MKILVIGSNGMLGKTLVNFLLVKGQEVITVARNNADFTVDLLTEESALMAYIVKVKPDVIINTAALINLIYCEENPGEAYFINGRLPGLLTNVCQEIGSYFIQISTDHYYKDDGDILHKESDPITLVNVYARSKYIGETLVALNTNALIVRTNIIGFKGDMNKPTFIEWVLNALSNNEEINGFEDFYTSSIDVESFSKILYELIKEKVTGIINIASKDARSKYDFIYALAEKKQKQHLVVKSSIEKWSRNVRRANTLGLDTSKLANIVGQDLVPSSEEVIEWVILNSIED